MRLPAFLRKLSWLFQRRDREAGLDEELRFHLDEEAEERGRDAARRELGNVGLIKEDTRAQWGWTWLDQLAQDLRYAVRTMPRNPAFTLLAALSLALGIGANTAIYSFMDALLVRRLPVADPASLVALNWHVSGNKRLRNSVVHNESGFVHRDPRLGLVTGIFPYPAFELLRKSVEGFSVLFAYHPAEKTTILIQRQAEVANGEFVSGDFFPGLEVAPAAGRLIFADDDRPGAPGVVVLSYGFARKRFGDAALAPGEPVSINNVPFTVIGVTPPEFFGVDPGKEPAFYLPMHADLLLGGDGGSGEYLDDHYYWIEMMARLRPGVTLAQAQAAAGSIFERWVAATASTAEERANLPEFVLKQGAAGLDNLRREYSRPLYVLLGMVGLILAIACANIANLLLARGAARRREIAVRLSMGAGRWRVVRQLLTESLLLATLGGVAGIFLAIWGVQMLTALLATGSDFVFRAGLNWHVLAAAIALTMLTGLLFGLAPALRVTRVDCMPALKESRTGERPVRARLLFSLSQALVVSQIALSLLLLVGAGLFVRTVMNLESIELGFQPEDVLSFRLNARQAGHTDPEIISFYRDLQQKFAAIPGVIAASSANAGLIGDEAWGWAIVPAGTPPPADAPTGHGDFSNTATHVLATGPGFFSTLRIPILAGRDFDDRDRAGSAPVAIVNEEWVKANLANRPSLGAHIVSLWPGKMLMEHGKPQEMEIVGVAKNARYDDLTDVFPPIVYLPYQQNTGVPAAEMNFFLRTSGNRGAVAGAVREIVRQADLRIPVTNLATLHSNIQREIGDQILFARLCTAFAILALAIACVGLYGTMSYIVARRTGEIGIRMALGAPRPRVMWMVMAQVMALAIAGLAIGIPVAYASSRLVESLLYGVKTNDAMSLAIAVATLACAALAAGFAPARRASRIDPVVALRHE
ncbi:MAG TPA: ABC transporter permease [Bryobacteraceae bacterium]|nr:ABC transporter permease [Bryobacteraceae bacterium]